MPKIFVSYKYSDSKVLAIPSVEGITTARDYVDIIETLITKEDHIFKGEDDGESMATLADATIGSKLGDKIFDSTITIVLMTKGMKENKPEKDQWIPWELSYSLKVQSRDAKNSKTNAVLAVVIPDENGSYAHFMKPNTACGSNTIQTDDFFKIIADNMFNIKDQKTDVRDCNGNKIYSGGMHSYISYVKWENFVSDITPSIEKAIKIKQNINNYNITKTIY